MSNSFIGEVKIYGFNFAPRFWAAANGQLMPINQNQALFSLLGTTFGGNGSTNFALPDLRGRTPIHFGNAAFGNFALGSSGGAATHTLTAAEMPAHQHPIAATTAAATSQPVSPSGARPASAAHAPYVSGSVSTVAMKAGLVSSVGSNTAHENMQPSFVLNFCVCLSGLFPSRN